MTLISLLSPPPPSINLIIITQNVQSHAGRWQRKKMCPEGCMHELHVLKLVTISACMLLPGLARFTPVVISFLCFERLVPARSKRRRWRRRRCLNWRLRRWRLRSQLRVLSLPCVMVSSSGFRCLKQRIEDTSQLILGWFPRSPHPRSSYAW